MPLPSKHSHCVVEYVAATLHTLIQPAGSMSLLVKGNRESLATTIVLRVDEGYVELIGMVGKVVSAGHACNIVSTVSHHGILSIPAAPAPTTSTRFRWDLDFPLVVMFAVGRIGSVSRARGIGTKSEESTVHGSYYGDAFCLPWYSLTSAS